MQHAAEFPHVSMKVSALMEARSSRPRRCRSIHPSLDALWAACGEDRLIYGSNWPVYERAGYGNSKPIYQWLDR